MSSKSLKLKLAVGAVALGAVLLVAQAILQFYLMRGELFKRIETQDFLVATALASHLDEKFDDRTRALAQAGTSVPQKSLHDLVALEKYLQNETALLTLFDDLYIFDAKGVLLVDWPVKPGRRGLDMASRDYIQAVMRTKTPFISKPILGKATKQPIIVLAAPVLNAQGELVAIMGGVLNLYQPNLVGALAQRKSGQNGYFFIVSPQDRMVIAHPDRERILKPVGAGVNVALDRAIGGFEGTLEGINSRGEKGMFTFRKMQSTGWVLASVVPLSEAYQPIATMQQQLVLSTVLLLLVAIPALWAFTSHLLHPLSELADGMQRTAASMSPGLPAEPVPETGSAEIRTVAHAFNEFLSARNTAEGALAASERRMSVLVANVREGIWDWSIAEDQVFLNPAMRLMVGLDEARDDVSNRDVLGRLHPDDEPRMQEAVAQCISGQTDLLLIEHRLVQPGGRVIWVSTTGRVVERDAHGQATRLLGTMVNISERREQLEKLALAKLEAESASQSKSNFLANMSHEIRTPMNGILGMTGLCLQTQLSAEQRSYLEMVDTSAHSLLSVINDILDFSKIEAQKLELDPHEFSLRELLKQTTRTLSLRASEKGLELVNHLQPDVPDALIGDPVRLQQVLTNLLGNAVKFTTRGEVVVHTRRVPGPQAGDSRIWLEIQVRDTGIGIPRDKQAHIFDAFTQADTSTARRFGGTGLGLAISRSLVQLMGGTLELQSQTGTGSTFTCTLPLELNRGSDLAETPLQGSLSGMQVLVVDDNQSVRKALRDSLQHLGCDVVLRSSAEQALQDDITQTCNLVLMDGSLPDMESQVLLARIRQARTARQLPVFLLGTFTQRPSAEHLQHEGVQGYMVKPLDLIELRETLGRLRPATPEIQPAVVLPPQAPARPAVAAGRKGLNILLAEDTPINQKLAMLLLDRMGHQVRLAVNGVEAVNACLEQSFDLVLMDIQMPEMGGIEATVQIRAREEEQGLPRVPIIALTANALKGDRELYLSSGMDGYVSKPIAVNALEGEIARLCAPAPSEHSQNSS